MINKLMRRLLFNRWSAFIHDLIWVPVVVFLCYWLRFNLSTIPEIYVPSLWKMVAVSLPVQGVAFWFFGLYRGLWRYASMQDLVRILKAVGIGSIIITCFIAVFLTLYRVPRTVLVLYPFFLFIGLVAPRVIYRWIKESKFKLRSKTGKRTLVVGAGSAGDLLLRDLVHHQDYLPVGIVDDDPRKHNREMHGVRILGAIRNIDELIGILQVDIVLVAITNADKQVIRRIVKKAGKFGVDCRTIPSSIELADRTIDVDQIRPVTVEDLLGRDSVTLDTDAIAGYLTNNVVLVTGGGGSIGSELCRQVAGQCPKELIVFENSEFNLYSIELELKTSFPDLKITGILGDVKNSARVNWVFEEYLPNVVFHAAAYKHVPLVEVNPAEGVNNNIFGTIIVANAAARFKTEKFVMVSTDKAVNPSNVMGTTKRIAEIYCQNMNSRSQTSFITTRFGNVLGSAGSVVPLFQKQIHSGGPVTVTSREVRRYFMTIPEATGLILQAGSMGEGGEIFVLDMGESVLIQELAEHMIKLSGYEPHVDIEIKYIGLRPGEKLYEEVFYEGEELQITNHPKLQLASCRDVDWHWLSTELEDLHETVKTRDVEKLRFHLRNIVPEFQNDHCTA